MKYGGRRVASGKHALFIWSERVQRQKVNYIPARRYQQVFIAFTILAVYYPTLSSGFCTVDDLDMVHRLSANGFSWLDTFLPKGRYYYRPLLILTYRFDQWAWDFLPSFMHLENILLHLANTLLVFVIAERFFRGRSALQSIVPSLAALLFGLHPLATESVNWISGRTDPLASLFIFLSVLSLFKAMESRTYRWALIASLAYIAGVMAKEVVVFFLPAALIVLWSYPQDSANLDRPFNRALASLVFGGPPLLMLVGFLVLRWYVGAGSFIGLSDYFAHIRFAPKELFWEFFKIGGFYIKKLFWPLPLSFAIVEVNPHFAWLGLLGFGGLIYTTRKRIWLWVPWVMAGVLLLPGFFIGIIDVTWTPLAERYAYLSAAFWAIGFVGLLVLWMRPRFRLSLTLGMLLLVVGFFSVTTVQRNLLWQNDLAFFSESLAQTPKHTGLRNHLGHAYLAQGQLAQAKQHFLIGLEMSGGEDPHLAASAARAFLAEGKPVRAREILLNALGEKSLSQASLPILIKLAFVDKALLGKIDQVSEKYRLGLEFLEINELLFAHSGNPVLLFRSGQLAMQIGEQQRAATLFARAYAAAPPDAFYRQMAGQLATDLKNEETASLD